MSETTFTITDTFGQTRRTTTWEITGPHIINPDGDTPLEQLGVRIELVDAAWRFLGPAPEEPRGN